MAHRAVLTARQRAVLFDLPTEEAALLKHYTLADDDGHFRCGWLLRHLDLLIDKMNQKSSFVQILKSVQQGLTSDMLD